MSLLFRMNCRYGVTLARYNDSDEDEVYGKVIGRDGALIKLETEGDGVLIINTASRVFLEACEMPEGGRPNPRAGVCGRETLTS